MGQRTQAGVRLLVIFLICDLGQLGAVSASTFYPLQNRRTQITMDSNRYGGLVIAIDRDVEENTEIISNIKTIISECSNYMLVATKFRAFISDVTILVPSSWSSGTYSAATLQTLGNARVIVGPDDPDNDVDPYTYQTRGCGEEAEFIHLTEGFVTNLEDSKNDYGDIGKVVLHEWAHLRWGVFDEHAQPERDYPYFYLNSNTEYRPVTCSANVKGEMKNYETGEDCVTSDGVLESDCRFYPDTDDSSISASIMALQFIDSVKHFCEDGDDSYLGHDMESPNSHNKHCSARSTWSVITDSPDFSDGANQPIIDTITSSDILVSSIPVFKIVRAGPPRYVLVMDTSRTMKGRKMKQMRISAANFIENVLSDEAWLGVVSSSTTATIVSELTSLSSHDNRHTLIEDLPTVAVGVSSIGDGIMKAIQVLEESDFEAAGAEIIIFVDGEENYSPMIYEVEDYITIKGAIVHAILISSEAEEDLATLAEETGGKVVSCADTDLTTSLLDALPYIVSGHQSYLTGDNVVQIMSNVTTVAAGSTLDGVVLIDSSANNNITFFIGHDSSTEDHLIVITDPIGRTLTSDGAEILSTILSDSYKIDGESLTGEWRYKITNNDAISIAYTVAVLTGGTTADQPIVVTSKLSHVTVNGSKVGEDQPCLYAALTSDRYGVVGAQVYVAFEDLTTGESYSLDLHDDGTGADIERDDGIYSCYVVPWEGMSDGRYAITINANDLGDDTKVAKTTSGSRAIKNYPGADLYDESEYTPTGRFQRQASGGSVKFVDTAAMFVTDVVAPSRILDLRIVDVFVDNSSLTLTWTAPGDDLDSGSAHTYELRVETTADEIYNYFDEAFRFTESDVIVGNLSRPLAAGSAEMYLVEFPRWTNTTSLAFGVKAYDSSGNAGAVSNVAKAVVVHLDDDNLKSEHQNTDTSGIGGGVDYTMIAFAISGWIICILFTVIVITLCRRMRKLKRSAAAATAAAERATPEPSDDNRDKVYLPVYISGSAPSSIFSSQRGLIRDPNALASLDIIDSRMIARERMLTYPIKSTSHPNISRKDFELCIKECNFDELSNHMIKIPYADGVEQETSFTDVDLNGEDMVKT